MILSEKPIICVRTHVPEPVWRISIDTAVRKLSPAHLDGYLSLQNSHNNCSCFRGPLQGRFSTNTFGGCNGDSAICLKASRFNHSCSPNACFEYDSTTRKLQLNALRAIPRGEEICVAYTNCRSLFGSTRRSRQADLLSRYHFTCMCSICSLSKAESKKSDARRQRLDELWETAGYLAFTQEDQCSKVVDEGIRLLREEGCLMDAYEFMDEAGPM